MLEVLRELVEQVDPLSHPNWAEQVDLVFEIFVAIGTLLAAVFAARAAQASTEAVAEQRRQAEQQQASLVYPGLAERAGDFLTTAVHLEQALNYGGGYDPAREKAVDAGFLDAETQLRRLGVLVKDRDLSRYLDDIALFFRMGTTDGQWALSGEDGAAQRREIRQAVELYAKRVEQIASHIIHGEDRPPFSHTMFMHQVAQFGGVEHMHTLKLRGVEDGEL